MGKFPEVEQTHIQALTQKEGTKEGEKKCSSRSAFVQFRFASIKTS